jgi:hypothetical protein
VDRLRAVGALADKSADQKRGDSGVAHGLEEGRGDLLLNGLDLLAPLVIGENTGSYVEYYGRAFLARQAETQRRIAVVGGACVLVGSVIVWEGGRFIYCLQRGS